MPLPSPATKANCDASTDDPKLALLTDLAGLVDTVNALITAIGAEYAPLASPTLTGNPTAPTQALRNSTTRLATTAFVLANLPLSGVLNKLAAYTLLAADFNKLVNATANTWSLGVDPTLGAGIICGVRNSGSGVITLAPVTGTIDGVASVALAAGESCLVESDGTNLLTVGRSLSFGSLSPTTTKGDLIVDNGTAPVRLPVGTNGQVLVADSTQAEGVKWGSSGVPTDVGVGGIGMIALCGHIISGTNINSGATVAGSSLRLLYFTSASGNNGIGVPALSGTWRNITSSPIGDWSGTGQSGTFQRIA